MGGTAFVPSHSSPCYEGQMISRTARRPSLPKMKRIPRAGVTTVCPADYLNYLSRCAKTANTSCACLSVDAFVSIHISFPSLNK